VDLYAFVSASILYFANAAFQNWAINGYMVAWRKHFREGGEITGGLCR